MKPAQVVIATETILLFALGLGIFVSKPVIYAASGSLVALALLRLAFDWEYRKALYGTWFTPASVGLFLLGVIAAAIHPGTIDEIAWVGRKLLYLPLLPVLYIAFMHPRARASGLTGVFVGFWVAAFLTMQNIGWQWSGGRIAGATWLVDVWGVLTGLFVSFLVPRIFCLNTTVFVRIFIAITAIAAFGMLLLSGARGPLLGVLVSGLVYLVCFQRKMLAVVVALTVCLYFPAKHFLPSQVNYLHDRVASITHTADPNAGAGNFNASNWVRLQLWKISVAQSLDKLENSPSTLLFGSGPNSQIHDIRTFFDSWTGMSKEHKDLLASYGYPTNEIHNMYLDSTGKMGVLWTLGSLILILGLVLKSLRMRKPDDQASLGVLLVSTNFLVTGITYDILPHWGTFFLVLLSTMAIHNNDASDRRRASGSDSKA